MQRRNQRGSTRYWFLPIAILMLVGALWVRREAQIPRTADDTLRAKLDSVIDASGRPEQSCAEWARSEPMVVLALGQSNAGNHGELSSSGEISVISAGKCLLSSDPLPGSTGSGGSIWSRLPTALRRLGNTQPVVLSVMGIDATSIKDWTDPDSRLRALMSSRLAEMRRLNMMPTVVLWQQGEADARDGTPTDHYQDGLLRLKHALEDAGSNAPILLALSTVCRSESNEPGRRAVRNALLVDARFRVGPDTDALSGPVLRRDGCHFTAAGLDEAASAWARSISGALSGPARRE